MNLQKFVVFVIDDDEAARNSLRLVLEIHGFTVCSYASGLAFLGDIPADRRGCLLIDVNMPEMNGLQLLNRLSAASFLMPAILITGQKTAEIQLAANCAGVTLLEKPIEPSELIGKVQEFANR